MVVNSDAIVQPRTVMVEAFHAPVADGAVAGARCAENETVGAHLAWMNLRKHIQKVVLLFQVARISGGSNEEAQSDKGRKAGNCVGEDIV